MKIYLCGGINALSDSEATDWRKYAKNNLATETLDPMRRDYRGIEHESFTDIVKGDLSDIVECDVVLANATRASWGTAMEIYFAYTIGRPIVAFLDRPDSASPWLLYHCHKLCSTLDEAIRAVVEVGAGVK